MSSTSKGSRLWHIHEWETSFFGVKTARVLPSRVTSVDIQSILEECRLSSVQVVHYLADADDDNSVLAAEQAGFHLVDVRITLEWNVTSIPSNQTNNCTIRDFLAKDVPVLQEIARSSYSQTRFYYDRHYSKERCDELYATWIAKTCQEESGRVIVSERDGAIVGFVTCVTEPDILEGKIGLVGVRRDAQGKAVGRTLVTEAQRWFAAAGMRRVTVVTQIRNISAQRLYQRCGFVTCGIGFWYHKWIE